MNPVVQLVDPKALRPHKLNKWLYGEPELPADYVDSIRNGGVREAIRATQALTIISGHRRTAGAIAAGVELVPVVIEPDTLDDLQTRRELIVSNKQREKTVVQRTREFDELAAVEKELAKQRQADHGKTAPGRKKNTSGKKTGSAAGEAAEIAAAQVGMSRSTAEKASEVVEEIDAADAAGDTAKAAELRDTLNNKSVAAAWRATTTAQKKSFESLKRSDPELASRVVAGELSIGDAQKILKQRKSAQAEAEPTNGQKVELGRQSPLEVDAVGVPVPRRLEKAFAGRTTCDAVLVQLSQIQKEANKFAELPGGEVFKQNAQAVEIEMKNVRAAWRFAKPYAVCPVCKANGKDCEACSKRGWVTEDAYKRIPKSCPEES